MCVGEDVVRTELGCEQKAQLTDDPWNTDPTRIVK